MIIALYIFLYIIVGAIVYTLFDRYDGRSTDDFHCIISFIWPVSLSIFAIIIVVTYILGTILSTVKNLTNKLLDYLKL